MAIYELTWGEHTLHGPFLRDAAPVLTIQSGDTVRFQTLDAGWGMEPFNEEGKRRRFEPNQSGHALCGPVAIEGAEPGHVLEVQINRIVPGSWGWTTAGGFAHPVNQRLALIDDAEQTLNWQIDNTKMVATNQFGHQVRLQPFMGILGMPDNLDGPQPTAPPRRTGGNIDCKELTAGSSLFLPIAVPGGLFSTGDGHAVQGHGEVAVPALECPMDVVDLTFILHKDRQLQMPRAKTPKGWLTFGFHEDLDEATMIALDEMLLLMGELYGLDRKTALGLASLVVDMHITQIVNGTKGAHALLPHGALFCTTN